MAPICNHKGKTTQAPLSAGLAALERVELVLEPIGVDPVGRQIRLLGQWFPAPTAESGTEADEVPAPGG